jgi:hypothetical protein
MDPWPDKCKRHGVGPPSTRDASRPNAARHPPLKNPELSRKNCTPQRYNEINEWRSLGMTEQGDQDIQPTNDWPTFVHFGCWTLLLVGLWLQWKGAMAFGFFLTIANLTSCFAPLILNSLTFIVLLPFPPKTVARINAYLFVALALVVQIWQLLFWIEGAAAH